MLLGMNQTESTSALIHLNRIWIPLVELNISSTLPFCLNAWLHSSHEASCSYWTWGTQLNLPLDLDLCSILQWILGLLSQTLILSRRCWLLYPRSSSCLMFSISLMVYVRVSSWRTCPVCRWKSHWVIPLPIENLLLRIVISQFLLYQKWHMFLLLLDL